MRFLALIFSLFCAPAWAGTITLTADITSSATKAYTVASNTVLDLNGHTITCAPGDPSTAVTFGVYALSASNVTIKNGTITGCFFGVHAAYSSNLTIENVNFTGNTYIGVNAGAATGLQVRNSTFSAIAGYTVEAYAIGINGVGSNAVIEDNTFSELYRQPGSTAVGEGVGIIVSSNQTNVIIRRNTFTNAVEGDDIGIWIGSGASNVEINDNIFTGIGNAILSSSTDDVLVNSNTFTLAVIRAGSDAIGLQSCPLDPTGGAVTYNHAIVAGNADGAFSVDPATGAVSENDPPGGSDRILGIEVTVSMPPPVVTTCVATGNTITNFAVPFGPGVTDGGGNLITP